MRRIYLEIFLSVVGTALLLMVVLGLWGRWYIATSMEVDESVVTETALTIASALPQQTGPQLQRRLASLAAEHEVEAVLWNDRGQVVAAAGPRPHRHHEGRRPPRRAAGMALHWGAVTVDWGEGGRLRVVPLMHLRPRVARPLMAVVTFLVAVGVGAYLVSRRIAGRLERLRAGVEGFGEGDLGARVEVEGRNEVADVARGFNRAAEQIERLVDAQRRMLASASHELRTPLARLRAAVELLAAGHHDRLPEAERDIAELDELIGDLLLAAKMETGETRLRTEAVDLFELVSEEAAAVEAGVTGESLVMRADPKLLRRMLRNLLENARRHGGANISVSLERLGGAEQTVADGAAGRVRLQVADRGPGILESDRVRIFEPFYRPLGHSEEHDGGVGLGLALVQGIAQHHGGEVSCRAREGGGTIFEVILPLVES